MIHILNPYLLKHSDCKTKLIIIKWHLNMFYGSKYICIFYLCNLLNRILHTCSIPECPILKQSKTTKQINRNNLFHNKLKDIKKEKKNYRCYPFPRNTDEFYMPVYMIYSFFESSSFKLYIFVAFVSVPDDFWYPMLFTAIQNPGFYDIKQTQCNELWYIPVL